MSDRLPHPVALVLGHAGRALVVAIVVSVNGRPVHQFAADLAHRHFTGAEWTIAAWLRREIGVLFRTSHLDSIEVLRIELAVNAVRLGAREARMFPGMRRAEIEELAGQLCDWIAGKVNGLPFGEAEPLYLRGGHVIA